METRRALDLSVQEVIYAGLEALEAIVPLELCAYLNRSEASGTQLFLGAPTLAACGGRAYDIFSGLRDALDRPRHRDGSSGVNGRAEEALDLAGVPTVVVVTVGSVSRGIHAFGRQRPFEARERAALARLAHALGVAGHRLQRAIEPTHHSS